MAAQKDIRDGVLNKSKYRRAMNHTHSTLCRKSPNPQRCRTVDAHECNQNDWADKPNHCSSHRFQNEDRAVKCCIGRGPGRSLIARIQRLNSSPQWVDLTYYVCFGK